MSIVLLFIHGSFRIPGLERHIYVIKSFDVILIQRQQFYEYKHQQGGEIVMFYDKSLKHEKFNIYGCMHAYNLW